MSMKHLDGRSQEFFAQYRTVAAKLKKRFMKKPNVRQASDDYSKLANALKNEENPQYAALCFAAMAKCDQMMNDSCGEAEAWANAGRQYLAAEEILYAARHASYQESLDAGVQCFILAIEAHEKRKNNVMAAMFCLEIAKRLKHFKKYHQALTFFNRAVSFQSDKLECLLQTLEEVAHCKIKLREYDSALNVLTKITSEAKGRVGPYELLSHRCEVSQLFLLLMLQIPKRCMKQEHIQLLSKYSQDILNKQFSGSDLETDLYLLLQSLIIAVDKGDYKEMETVQPMMWQLLQPDQRHLFFLLMEAHNPYRQNFL